MSEEDRNEHLNDALQDEQPGGAPVGSASKPPAPPPAVPPPYAYPPPARGGLAGRLFLSLITALLLISIVLNVYLGLFFVRVTSGPWETTYQDGDSSERIAIIPVMGTIDGSTASFIKTTLDHLRKNPPQALVLRIDSGGGLVGPCDRIWHELERFKEYEETRGIPIVASFGSVAASGGYYICTRADFIMAEPITTTGSIGVMAPIFTVDRLLQKIGVTPEIIVAPGSPNKAVANDITRPWTEKDRKKVTEFLDRAHDRFVQVVYEGRKTHFKSREEAELVANGDIFSTRQAIDNHLVDGEGYIDDALAKAAALAGFAPTTKPKVTIFKQPYKLSMMSLLTGSGPSLPQTSSAELIEQVLLELSTPRAAYRMWR